MNAGLQMTTLANLRLILNAILECDCVRDEGKAFAEMKDKSLTAFKSKLYADREALNVAVAMHCQRLQIPWKKCYKLNNVCKTPRQFNWLANELKHYIVHKNKKSLETNSYQMEFDLA